MDAQASAPWTVAPRLPASFVPRPRIDGLLDDACQAAPVVAVMAGAGYGKTTALSAWSRQRGGDRSFAWVNAQMAAAAPGGLWQALWLSASRAVGRQDGNGDGVPNDQIPQRLLDLFARSAQPFVFILDDLHEVTDRAALASLDLLLAYLPARTNLIVASRWEPPLRLAGRRVGGQLSEIRTGDLSFDALETHRLLDACGVAAEDAAARRLTQIADGWPIALRLAASVIAGGEDVDDALGVLNSREGPLARYLAHEVLDRLPPPWREVLTTVSIVEQCHADLAVSLTGIAEAGEIIERAAAETGLFHQVPGKPGWLQAHPLAWSFLRVELEAARGADVDHLHHQAATWFAAQEDWGRALEHALHDPHSACLSEIITRVGLEPLLRSTPKGQEVAARVTRTSPARWPLGRPLALAVAVLANADAAAASGSAEALRHTRFDTPADERLRVVALARVWRNLGRNDLACAALREATWAGASSDELVLLHAERVLAGCDGAGYETIREHALEALAHAETCDADRLSVHLHVALAALALIEGEPRGARDHADAAALLGTRFGDDLAIPLAEAQVIRATTALELGDGERLAVSSLTPLPSAAHGGPVHLRLAAAALDLRQRWRDGDDPRRLLQRVSEVLAGIELENPDPGFLVSIIELELSLAEAVQDLPRAESAVQRLPASYQQTAEAAFLRAHVHRIRRAYAQARRELLPAIHGELVPMWPSIRLKILALDGVLAGLEGSSDTASLEEAVELAVATGRRRPFIELGADALRVLSSRRAALRADADLVGEIIAELELLTSGPLAAPLTQAELRVLQRLPSMATLQEIADGLHLSRNTVKTHAASIYRKLGADSRRAAVARGRELGLLRPTADAAS